MCFGGGEELTEQQKAEQKNSSTIAKKLREQFDDDSKEIKILLLGSGGSGKSTIFKQMKILHMGGYKEKELLDFRGLVHRNVFDSFGQMIEACDAFELEINSKHKKFIEELQELLDVTTSPELSRDYFEPFCALWADEAIQTVFQRGAEYNLLDSAEYFIKELDRISKDSFIPTVDDILRTRSKTVGIVEQHFKSKNQNLLMVDVGGQRNERRKWIHAFDGVTAIIYVASLADYNQVLEEDSSTNRMIESITLFKDICNDKSFKKKTFLIFFNKDDIFQERIKKIDLNVTFQDYKGGKNYENAFKFIQNQYETQNLTKGRKIYSHATNSTDTKLIEKVFDVCQAVILKQLLAENQMG